MKNRNCQFLVLPLSLWLSPDLTVMEKAVVSDLYSIGGGQPVKHITTVASDLSIPKAVVKEVISSLARKGAVTVCLDDSGDTLVTPLVFKPRYKENNEIDEHPNVGESQAMDYQSILDHWRMYNPSLPCPRKFTPKMQKQLHTLLKNNSTTLDELFKVFAAIGCSEFCQGNNDRGWVARLDWVISDRGGSYQKILQGAYHRSQKERIEFDEIFIPAAKSSTQEDYYR